MAPPLRIAAHNGARLYGGGEKWTILLLNGLQKRGHTVHLYCNHEDIVGRAEAMGVGASLHVLGGHLMLSDAWRFAGTLRAFKPDALLLSTFKKVWLGGMAGRRAGVPTVVSRIGLDTDLPQKHWSYRLAYRRWVDATLANADGIRRDIVAGFPPYAAGRVATVYDGIPPWTELPTRGEARNTLGLPPDVPVVGAVGRLSGQKRLDRFLETLTHMPNAVGVLAGDGELASALHQQAATLGLVDRVHFLGFREDVQTVLAALDVLLITSDNEGMANAMLEAMAAGVPVVSTPVSGAEEALGADQQGRIAGRVVSAEAPTLAGAVSGIIDVPAVRLAMGNEGRRRAGERFAYEVMLDAWEAVLGGDDPARWHQGQPTPA